MEVIPSYFDQSKMTRSKMTIELPITFDPNYVFIELVHVNAKLVMNN